MAHPFFSAHIDLKALKKKLIEAPYKPTVPDFDTLRSGHHLINFKDFTETIIPRQKQDLVNKKCDEFDVFGEISEVSYKS